MTATASDRLMTTAELEQLPDDGYVHELSRGRLIRTNLSSTWSGVVAGNILASLGAHVRANELGLCGAAGGLKLASNPDTVRVTSLWFIRADRVPAVQSRQGFWPIAPDLAIEVVSQTDHWAGILYKVVDYLEAGTNRVWVVDGESHRAIGFTADAPPQFVPEDGVLDGGDLIPGFTVALADILD